MDGPNKYPGLQDEVLLDGTCTWRSLSRLCSLAKEVSLHQRPRYRKGFPRAEAHVRGCQYQALAGLFVDSEVVGKEPTFSVIREEGLELDGHMMKAYDDVQGDSQANSFLHVPDLELVVAGDLAYGHQFLVEANTREKRENWIKAVEYLESFKPQIILCGHTRKSQVPAAYLTAPTKEYIRVFGEELEKAESAVTLEAKMKELYPERWNDTILQVSCESSFSARGT